MNKPGGFISRAARFVHDSRPLPLWPHALAVAVVAATAALLFPHHAPDTERFLAEAKNLAAQNLFSLDGATPTVRDFPAIPFLLSLLLRLDVADPQSWMRVLNGVCLGVTAWLSGVWLHFLLPKKTWWRRLWPVAGVWAAGLCPELLGSTLFVLTEPLYTAVFLGANLMLWRGLEEPRRRTALLLWLGGGLLLGLACLARAVPLLFLAGAALPAALLLSNGWRVLGRGLAALLVMAAVIAPWTLRNWQTTGRFIPVAFGTGTYLYVGAAAEWNAEWPDFDPASVLQEKTGAPLHECDSMLGREAMNRIRNDPAGWISLLPQKWEQFWLAVPGSKRQIGSSTLVGLLMAVNGVVLVLAALGAWFQIGRAHV